MRKLSAALLILLASVSAALAQAAGNATTTGGMTTEVCTSPTVQTSAYTTGRIMGGLLALTPSFRGPASGAPDSGGITESIRINFKDAQTATFKAYQFTSKPGGTWADNGVAAIQAADAFKVLGPIALTSPDSGLGTHTVYQTDAIMRTHVSSNATDYWVIIVVGTPTLGSASDFQFCASYLVD